MEKWRWGHMQGWTVAIIIVSVIMCFICSCSCFYNYRLHRDQVQPWPMPAFCPDCLFPRRNIKDILRENKELVSEEEEDEEEDVYTHPNANGFFTNGLPTPNPGSGQEMGTTSQKPAKIKGGDKYKVPDLSDISLN